MIAPYIADQIKVTQHLTVSAGLRYEPWLSPVVSAGRIAYYVPNKQQHALSTGAEGMLFPGDAGVASAGGPSDYHRYFDPRLGIAWQPKALPNTSVRLLRHVASPMEYGSYNQRIGCGAVQQSIYSVATNTSNGAGG